MYILSLVLLFYCCCLGVQEEVTSEEIQENRDFIDAIVETKVIIILGARSSEAEKECPTKVTKLSDCFVI